MSERKGQTKAGLETHLLPAINCIKEMIKFIRSVDRKDSSSGKSKSDYGRTSALLSQSINTRNLCQNSMLLW